jgi:hypothetical protein
MSYSYNVRKKAIKHKKEVLNTDGEVFTYQKINGKNVLVKKIEAKQ